MRRREFIANTAAMGIIAAAATVPALRGQNAHAPDAKAGSRLTPPATGPIPVAVAISDGVTVIDFSGPWEVFQDVTVPNRGKGGEDESPFRLYTVSEKTEPLRGSAGLQLVPDYTFENAPQPKVIVVPAQRGSQALHDWLRKASPATDVTMSVCTGAFQLARAGLLSGQSATTHHDFLDRLAKQFPDINVKRGLRFVEANNRISTAGGLSSGIDLALRVVDRYFGREVAQQTAFYMEYQSKGWIA